MARGGEGEGGLCHTMYQVVPLEGRLGLLPRRGSFCGPGCCPSFGSGEGPLLCLASLLGPQGVAAARPVASQLWAQACEGWALPMAKMCSRRQGHSAPPRLRHLFFSPSAAPESRWEL